MEEIKKLKATYEDNDIRLDVFIGKHLIDISRTFAKTLIDDGRVKVNNKAEKASYKVKKDDIIEVAIPELKETEIVPEDINIDVLYEDDDVIVVNKPRGMVVHPASGNYTGTLVNGLLAKTKNLSHINGDVRPGIVHRIDKDTSGVLVIAKNDFSHTKLSEQLSKHSMNRIYYAIVNGKLDKDEFTIDAPIGRSPKDRKKMAIVKNGKRAVTHINVIEKNDSYSFIRVKLETGRTHQIRVHMSAIGHSLVGDLVYGRKKNKFDINGQALHAALLGFIHPISNEYIEFKADLPEDFKNILKEIGFKVLQIKDL